MLREGQHAAERKHGAETLPVILRELRAAAITMQEHAAFKIFSVSFDDGVEILVGFPHVEYDGEPELMGEPYLPLEYRLLDVAGGEVVMIVQSDLAEGDDFGGFGEGDEPCFHLVRIGLGFVRVYADNGVYVLVLRRERHAPLGGWQVGGSIHDDADARRPSGGNDLRFPLADGLVVQMRVRVYVHYLTSLPDATTFSGLTSTTPCSGSSAQSSIPWLSTPRKACGARFATTTTSFPTISSGV